MAFKIDFDDGDAIEWRAVESGLQAERVDFRPTIYANADESTLDDLAAELAAHGDVVTTVRERFRPAFRREPTTVLRIDVESIDRVRPLAGWLRRSRRPGDVRLFNVDFSPQFRYCLEEGVEPVPERPLRVLELTHPGPGAPAAPVEQLQIDGEAVSAGPAELLTRLQDRLEATDPDVLVLSTGEIVPALFEMAETVSQSFQLGRRAGYEQLASASPFESYGQVGHSPARYDVPGRAIVDRSNTFFYSETNLDGCLDLVARSYKPIQELSWASIGNVLTAIQIRGALDRGVLVPWKSWRHEFPKSMRQLHEADRGGFTFAPDVGVHEDVHELDFSSLYPNIIRTRNISPETIRCDCHERADVPGLGYSICDEPGYLPDVLGPIIDDRDEMKAAIEATDDPEREAALEGQSSALKWILVSCFGYQGFSNAKFGRIECHEAINAFAREILLDGKAQLEDAGWRLVHGIVDSLWATARESVEQTPLDDVAAGVTDTTRIRLEHEAVYDWIAFVPLRTSESGALTKYFGRRRDGSYKYRGIECRQRSTAPFVADCQRALIETFDRTRDPEAVCVELASWIDRLDAGAVDPDRLTIRTRTSKALDEYDQRNRTTAALERRLADGHDQFPGQDVRYVVVDDSKAGRDRVRLPYEDGDDYDSAFYRERLLRAAESVLSPVGWRESDIESRLADREAATLGRFRK
jgi:DNA polymerase I